MPGAPHCACSARHGGLAGLHLHLSRRSAAKSRARPRLILIPLLDILQSVPILGFLTFTTAFFMGLFPGSVLGLELRRHLRHLHQPGLEHGLQLLPVARRTVPHGPRRRRRAASASTPAGSGSGGLEVPFADARPGLER
jgi:hypothetical protein